MSSVQPPSEHERAFELLPWFVNDTLAHPERETVEMHVRTCITCRREVKDQQRLLAVLQRHPTVHLSEQNGFERLTDVLDGGERPAREPRYAPFMRFGVVATLGVALVVGLLWLAPEAPRDGGYATLADAPAAAARTAQLDVVFTRDTTAAEIAALLNSIDVEIVAGPSEIGRYGVRLTREPAGDAELARALERLASDPHVRFAGRSLEGAQ
jgi:hypothetical protein